MCHANVWHISLCQTFVFPWILQYHICYVCALWLCHRLKESHWVAFSGKLNCIFCLITAFVCLLHELSLLSEWVALGCIDHVVVNYSEYCDPVINCSTASYLQWTDGDGGFLLSLRHRGWRADHPVCLEPILLAQILASAAGVGCNKRPNCWLQLHRWGRRQACTGMWGQSKEIAGLAQNWHDCTRRLY